MSEEPNGIPSGWVVTTIAEIALVNPRIDKSKIPDDLDVSFVPMPAVEAGNGVIDVSDKRKFLEVKKGYTPFLEGDVLFAKITPCMENGKMAIVPPLINHLGFGSTEFHVLRPHTGIQAKFVYYFVSSKSFRLEAEHNMSGAVGQKRVPTGYLSECSIPLPPLAEQSRIVAKIEELFTELDAGIASLRTAQAQLKTYRQALLKHAFAGRLTAAWRAENAEKLEPAARLLQRIADERQARYAAEVAEWESGGKTGRKPRPLKDAPPLSAAELADLPALPAGWAWVKVGSVSDIGTGVTPLKSREKFYEDGTIPWVTSGALNDSYVTEPSGFVTKTALEETNLSLYPKHTLLVAMYGEGKTRGKCSELLIEATTNQAIAAIVQEGSSEKIRRYLKWFLQKNYDDLRLKSSGGVQPNLNLGIIANIAFPMCSIRESGCLVEMIEEKFSVIDQLEQTITTGLQQAESLRQSILQKAFAGRLVPQEPADEPAAALLARIRAAKE